MYGTSFTQLPIKDVLFACMKVYQPYKDFIDSGKVINYDCEILKNYEIVMVHLKLIIDLCYIAEKEGHATINISANDYSIFKPYYNID